MVTPPPNLQAMAGTRRKGKSNSDIQEGTACEEPKKIINQITKVKKPS
jgi:hypothetical protein